MLRSRGQRGRRNEESGEARSSVFRAEQDLESSDARTAYSSLLSLPEQLRGQTRLTASPRHRSTPGLPCGRTACVAGATRGCGDASAAQPPRVQMGSGLPMPMPAGPGAQAGGGGRVHAPWSATLPGWKRQRMCFACVLGGVGGAGRSKRVRRSCTPRSAPLLHAAQAPADLHAPSSGGRNGARARTARCASLRTAPSGCGHRATCPWGRSRHRPTAFSAARGCAPTA